MILANHYLPSREVDLFTRRRPEHEFALRLNNEKEPELVQLKSAGRWIRGAQKLAREDCALFGERTSCELYLARSDYFVETDFGVARRLLCVECEFELMIFPIIVEISGDKWSSFLHGPAFFCRDCFYAFTARNPQRSRVADLLLPPGQLPPRQCIECGHYTPNPISIPVPPFKRKSKQQNKVYVCGTDCLRSFINKHKPNSNPKGAAR